MLDQTELACVIAGIIAIGLIWMTTSDTFSNNMSYASGTPNTCASARKTSPELGGGTSARAAQVETQPNAYPLGNLFTYDEEFTKWANEGASVAKTSTPGHAARVLNGLVEPQDTNFTKTLGLMRHSAGQAPVELKRRKLTESEDCMTIPRPPSAEENVVRSNDSDAFDIPGWS